LFYGPDLFVPRILDGLGFIENTLLPGNLLQPGRALNQGIDGDDEIEVQKLLLTRIGNLAGFEIPIPRAFTCRNFTLANLINRQTPVYDICLLIKAAAKRELPCKK
jgi:hypothetical protein